MPATTKYSKDEVQKRISDLLVNKIDTALVTIYPHEAFDGNKRLYTGLGAIASWSNALCAAVADSSGLSPQLSANEILAFAPKTMNDLVSLIHNRLQNRNQNFVETQVMNVLKGIGGSNMQPGTTFASLGWSASTIKSVIRSVRAAMARDIRFITTTKQMDTSQKGADLINMICQDFITQQRQ